MDNKIIINSNELKCEINVLKGYDQSIGLDIHNMLDIAEHKLNKLCTITDPENESHDLILQEVFPIITMVRQVRNLTPDALFLAIENIIFKLEESIS